MKKNYFINVRVIQNSVFKMILGWDIPSCTPTMNIPKCSSFNYLSKLLYSNSSIVMEYDDFVKFSSFKNYDFRFDPLHDWMTKSDHKS